MKDINFSHLSWSDHYLVTLGLTATTVLLIGCGAIKIIYPRHLMDPVSFHHTLGKFLSDVVDSCVCCLAEYYSRETAKVLNRSTAK